MGGELIVNTNQDGDLYSMSGELSTKLSLPARPTIDSEQARETALQAVAKWHEKSSEDFISTEPELWIYDEGLLQPSARPVELVWRMEVTPLDNKGSTVDQAASDGRDQRWLWEWQLLS